MSFFDKSSEGSMRQNYGRSESSGDVTATPRTPTREFSARTGRQTPIPYYSRPQPFPAGHGHGDAGPARQNLRNIWDDASRAGPQNTTTTSTSSIPGQAVLYESSNNLNYDPASTQRRMESTPAHAGESDPQMDIQAGFARLRLADSMSQQSQASVDAATRPYRTSYSYGAHTSAAPAIPPTVEATSSLGRISVWSTYDNQTNSSWPQNHGIETLSDPYVSGSVYLPVRIGAATDPRPRPSSETNSNFTPADLPPPQRQFSTQLVPPITPMRIGQSPQPATPPDHRGPSGGGPAAYPPQQPPPRPFLIQPRNQGFLPMHAVHSRQDTAVSSGGISGGSGMLAMGALGMPLAPPRQPAPASRFSNRYHGMHTESNASADHLSAEQNASLWITNLPPDITHHELLGQIRRIGRVWCCFINGPDGVKHDTAAAKIVFFRPDAARRLLQQSIDGPGLSVRGWRAKVAQNRIKTGETIPRTGDDSRVLLITGQENFVNEAMLTRYFSERFVFQVDEVRQLVKGGGRAVVEFRFGSYRCQAQMGKISLEKDRPLGFEKAEFGEDPCEVGETLTSYTVALERMRGHGL